MRNVGETITGTIVSQMVTYLFCDDNFKSFKSRAYKAEF